MKLLFVKTALCVGLLSSTQLYANGTITINGLVVDGTCTLQIGAKAAGNRNAVTVTLKNSKTSDFSTTTREYPAAANDSESFTMQLVAADGEACPTDTFNQFKSISITAGANDILTTTPSVLKNTTGTGNNVGIQILTKAGDAVDLSDAINQAKSPLDDNTTRTITYRARYYFTGESGSATAQTVTATANYTLNYN